MMYYAQSTWILKVSAIMSFPLHMQIAHPMFQTMESLTSFKGQKLMPHTGNIFMRPKYWSLLKKAAEV